MKLLRNRSFAALWSAQVVSQSGDAIFDVALLWLVYATTGSTALVGVVEAAVLLPAVFVGPLAGVYADRLNRRNLMIASSLFQGAATAVLSFLFLLGWLTFPPLFLMVLLLYSGASFFRAANSAIIPRLVEREELGAANSLFTLTTSANQLVNFSIGGIVIATVGYAASITYDSLSFFIAAALLTLVARSLGAPRGEAASGSAKAAGFWKEFGEGMSYVKRDRLFLELVFFGILVNFFGGGVFTLLVPYVKSQLGGDAFDYGVALSAFALGGIVGATVVGKLDFRAYVGKLVFGGVVASGILIALAGLATNLPEGLVLFFGIGAMSGAFNPPLQVVIQTHVPGEVLGRAATVLGALLGISQPIASVFFGVLAGFSSVGMMFEASGVAVILSTLVVYLPFRELREAKY